MDPETRRLTLPQALEHARELVRQRIREDRDRARHADLRRFLEHLAVHVFDADLSLSRLRRKLPDAMWAAFRRELGARPAAYKAARKLEGVAWLLRRTDVNVFYLADFAGYSGLTALASAFRKWSGMAPTEYRKELRGGDVIEIVPDEMETDELWWKAILGLLSPDQAMRLFTRMVEWFPFLDPCPAPRWQLRTRGHDKAELVPLFEDVWSRIRQLAPEAQLEVVRERIETDSADFFHFLCEKSLEEGREAPDRGVEVMELALVHLRANAEHLGAEAAGLEVLGVARLGNAHMVASHIFDAERELDAAARDLKIIDVKEVLVEAEMTAYRSTLLLLQGRQEEAEKLLGHAINTCRDGKAPRLLAQCLIQRSTIAGYQDRLKESIHDLHDAMAVLRCQFEPRLMLAVHSNLATFHALALELEAAETHLTEAKALCHGLSDRVIRQHLHWTEALICAGRSDLQAAAIELEKARSGFKDVGQPGYSAMAALELATIRLEQDFFEEVVTLAAEAIPVLEHFPHATGVAAALALLHEGLAARRITRGVLEEARKALHGLWRNPSLDLGAINVEDGPDRNRPPS